MQKQDSLDESVQMDTPPRSPPDPSTNEELIEISHLPPVPTQIKERSEMTPRQRWHVAFNKIVIQLNVSKLKNILIFASNI
ncbi:PREDICTED: uncharacterized protein LOC105366155 [Ceratosolen solmsi marchali]|uniref:Uncharacterized protein LOC105366155 n=1 Tax=Ceratosolen solmsi marchali TaxID=326594 RepID=A0AAJ7E050_9HYME|nr:PREDICTED: uncharacterized protein LOC105366155 [Ceratosolen solmsi marchali]